MPFGSPDGASDRTAHVDLTFSEADEQFRTEFRRWLDANLPKEWRERGFWRKQGEAGFEMRRTWEAGKAKAGFAGIQWPQEYGGRRGGPAPPGGLARGEGPPPRPPDPQSPRQAL